MFTNIVSLDSKCLRNKKPSLKNIYRNFISGSDQEKNIKENMSSQAGTINSDESFITPVSSTGDLMTLSPQRTQDTDITSDFLTGTEFDSICDDMIIDANSLVANTCNIDKGKESLLFKFDPLCANNLLRNIKMGQRETETDVGYETSSATSFITDNIAESSKTLVSSGTKLTRSIKDKPTQIVPPVVSSDVQTKQCPTQPKFTPALIRSVSAILTPTRVATERLVTFSNNSSPEAAPPSPCVKNFSSQEFDRLQSLRNILQNQENEVFQLRQANKDLKFSLQDLKRDLSRSQEEYDLKINKLTEKIDTLQVNECKLKQQLDAKTIHFKQMCIVVEEYEKTIAAVIAEQQKEKIQSQELLGKLASERDQALDHLANMESSFNDLLSKYEKCKCIIMETKEREKILREKILEYEAGLEKYRELYDNLKLVTSENLQNANVTLDNIKKSHNVDITKLNAIIKKHEITISSLQDSLAQKSRDNEELTKICDQLINKVH